MIATRTAQPRASIHLLRPTEWVARYFDEGSRPPAPTLRKWMQNGDIPARKIGGSWFVDETAWLAAGDELVARVLAGG